MKLTVHRTFGDISANVLSVIMSMHYKYTALVGNNYTSSKSIKSQKRASRGSVPMQEVRNPKRETPIPRQMSKHMSNPSNK